MMDKIDFWRFMFYLASQCIDCLWIQTGNFTYACEKCGSFEVAYRRFDDYDDYWNFRKDLYEWGLSRSAAELQEASEEQITDMRMDLL